MTGDEWSKSIAESDRFWYAEIDKSYPIILSQMYSRLRTFAYDGNIYGFFLEMRDIYEALIRLYVLTGIAMASEDGDTKTVALLCNPEISLSFGDWAQVLPTHLLKHQKIGSCALGKTLENLKRFYAKKNIVQWRNDSLGHGALQQDTSQEFQQTLEGKLSSLCECLEGCSDFAGKIIFTENEAEELYCLVENGSPILLSPFIRKVEGDYRLFDSIARDSDNCKELSYQTGVRTKIRIPLLSALRTRYYGDISITKNETLDEEVFTGQVEAALQHYHYTDTYWKQTHYIDWLKNSFSHYDKGVFLLQAESGTGKSTFASYLDGFGKAGIAKLGFTCRAYCFSRMSFRSVKDFPYALFDLFRQVPEDNTDLRGNLPELDLSITPENRGSSLADFLNEFRTNHRKSFGRDKLLLVLDGIDELPAECASLLHFIPTPEQLEEGVYVLVTCRSDLDVGTFQHDFIDQHAFVEKKVFLKAEENEKLLSKAVNDSVLLSGKTLNEQQVEKIIQILDKRFTGLPVIRAVLEHAEDFEASLNAPSLLCAYLGLLKRYYGAKHYCNVKDVLLTLALAVEPLSLRQISDLAWEEQPTVELLAIMRDVSPLLLSLRTVENTKYILGHTDFGTLLRNEFQSDCRDFVLHWRGRTEGDLRQIKLDYEWATYIASGMYLWHKDVLHEDIRLERLENMGTIAEIFSQTRDTGQHLQRTARILNDSATGALEYWQRDSNMYAAAMALHFMAASIPKLVQMEDTQGCAHLDELSEKLILALPEDVKKEGFIVKELFFNYANRMTMMDKFGDTVAWQKYYDLAVTLLFDYSEWIPNIQQIPFLHNAAISLSHTNPLETLRFCDIELSFPECTCFQRALALILKSNSLKKLNRQEEAGVCIRQAVSMVENEAPRLASDVVVYPNALFHLGQHLSFAEQDFTGAIQVLEKALSIYNSQSLAGALCDRFEAARILSSLGYAYRCLDKGNDHKEQCLWCTSQSIEIYRLAKRERIKFQPAAAEPIFINAAYTYLHYKMPDDALKTLDELEKMQNPSDIHGQNVLERCRNVRNEISHENDVQ